MLTMKRWAIRPIIGPQWKNKLHEPAFGEDERGNVRLYSRKSHAQIACSRFDSILEPIEVTVSIHDIEEEVRNGKWMRKKEKGPKI